MKIILTKKETNSINKVLDNININILGKSLFEIIKEKFYWAATNNKDDITISLRSNFVINIINIFEKYINIIIPMFVPKLLELFFDNRLALDIDKAILEERNYIEEDIVYEEIVDGVIKYMNTYYFPTIKYKMNPSHFIDHMLKRFENFDFTYTHGINYNLIITDLSTNDKFKYRFIVSEKGKFSGELISKNDEPIQILVEDEYEKIRNSSIIKAVEDLLAIGTKDINKIVGFLDGHTPDTMNRIITSTKPTNFLYINDKDLGSFRYDIVTKEIVINPDQMVDYLKYFVEDESEKVNDIVKDNNEVVYLFGITDNNICVETKENNDLHSAIESTIDIRRRCKHKDQDGFNAIIINENNEFVCKVCGSIFERRL